MATTYCFAGYPDAVLVDDNGKPQEHILWGSYLRLTGQKDPGFLQVKRGNDLYWIDEVRTRQYWRIDLHY